MKVHSIEKTAEWKAFDAFKRAEARVTELELKSARAEQRLSNFILRRLIKRSRAYKSKAAFLLWKELAQENKIIAVYTKKKLSAAF